MRIYVYRTCIFAYPIAMWANSATVPGNNIKDTEEDGVNVFVGVHKTNVLLVLAKQGIVSR